MFIRRISAAVLLTSSTGFAAPFAISDTATGVANPPQIQASSPADVLQNGDFRISPIEVDPFPNAPTVRTLGDATEEWTRWTMSFNGLPAFTAIQAASLGDVTITSATITLSVRTGGDTPNDDVLVIDEVGFSPALGYDHFQTYGLTYNLLNWFDDEAVLASFITDGEMNFVAGNDHIVYGATLDIAGEVVPEPSSIAGICILAAGFASLRRRSFKRL